MIFSSTDFLIFFFFFLPSLCNKGLLLFFFAFSVVTFVDLTSKIEFCFTLSSSHKSNLLLKLTNITLIFAFRHARYPHVYDFSLLKNSETNIWVNTRTLKNLRTLNAKLNHWDCFFFYSFVKMIKKEE